MKTDRNGVKLSVGDRVTIHPVWEKYPEEYCFLGIPDQTYKDQFPDDRGVVSGVSCGSVSVNGPTDDNWRSWFICGTYLTKIEEE